jgi:type VI secretion system secreted protein VgrG
MAQLTESSININGKSIAQFSSFTLQQNIFEHHNFTLVCPAESIDGKEGSIFNQSKDLIGAPINAQIKMIGGKGRLDFAGIVTQVETARFSGHAGDVIITGYSPTILLDNGPHCKSWEKKALKNIAEDCLKHFPKNLLNPKITPTYGETLSYTVQYKETAWQFLNRMGATYGDWLYYNGKSLVLGKLTGEAVNLIFGSNLNRFNMSLQVRPSSFQMMAYDYMNNEVYDTTPSGIEGKAGLDRWGKHVYAVSKKTFATQPKAWCNNFTTNKKQLDQYSNTKAAAQSSNMVRFNGGSGNPGVQLGSSLNVNGNNAFNASYEAYGKFKVIGVTHHTDGLGNYSNDFLAIPDSITAPPVTAFAEPHCETQSAIVTDNNDPQHLGRVRVRFHWMKPSEKTPWIRITSPHGGGDKGMFFIPELDEEAIICFEGDSAIKPFVNGTVYHGKAKTSFANAGNDVKALQTRSGNKMVMNDKDGSVHISDKGPADFTLNGAGNADLNATKIITLKAGEQISLICGESSITLYKDGTIIVNGKKIFTDGSTSVAITSGESSGMVIKPATLEAGSQTTTVSGTNELNVGGAKVNVGGGAEVNVSSGKISMN